jgi:hypothetical protein
MKDKRAQKRRDEMKNLNPPKEISQELELTDEERCFCATHKKEEWDDFLKTSRYRAN